ncbi:hypothetical protein SK128_000286, partial [Halocaridina rubra]
ADSILIIESDKKLLNFSGPIDLESLWDLLGWKRKTSVTHPYLLLKVSLVQKPSQLNPTHPLYPLTLLSPPLVDVEALEEPQVPLGAFLRHPRTPTFGTSTITSTRATAEVTYTARTAATCHRICHKLCIIRNTDMLNSPFLLFLF